MKAFTDNTGFTWQIRLDRAEQNRVYADTGFDPSRITEPGAMDKLKTDANLRTDILFAMCREQADAINVDRDDFAQRLKGTPTAMATALLYDALVQFFPAERQGFLACAIWAGYHGVSDEVMQSIVAAIRAGE